MTLDLKFSWAKGDISIKTLVAIVIGIIVLAVVIYLMFFYSQESSLDCHLCSSKFAEWCQKCLTAEKNWNRPTWGEDVPKSDELKECLDTCTNIDPEGTCNALQSECKKYIYIPPTTTTT
jgi:flagellar basal body-associated protein FliL